ncbi:MAG TPA: hypothetical protein VMJ32_10820 [Pirellulales bacterium]|nr:hypothetical protein [Pirellulales bacterium]
MSASNVDLSAKGFASYNLLKLATTNLLLARRQTRRLKALLYSAPAGAQMTLAKMVELSTISGDFRKF